MLSLYVSVAINSAVRMAVIKANFKTNVLTVTTVSLMVLDEDPGVADRLSRELRRELQALDVDRVDLVLDGEVPPGAKADVGTVTAIVVALSGSPVLVQLGRVLRDWVNRGAKRKIVVREGDRSIEISGYDLDDAEAFFSSLERRELE